MTEQRPIRSSQRNLHMISGTLLLLNLSAVSCFSFGGPIRVRSPVERTRRFGAPADAATPNGSNADLKFLQRIPSSKRTVEENDKIEEEAVDEYLEFLDRRYKRLHDKETPNTPAPTKTPFSALGWLKQEQITDSILSEQIKDDALYVLGVAGLASKRLLHKHQIPESYIKPMGSAEVKGEDAIDVSTEIQTGVKTSLELGKMIAHVTKARQALYAYQTRKLLGMLKALLSTPSRLLKKMWVAGGGRRNLTITVTLASILTVALIRPVLIAIGKESLNLVGSP